MASMTIFHYLMIITIASAIASISGRYRRPLTDAYWYDMVLNELNDRETNSDDYQYVRPHNLEASPTNFVINGDDRNVQNLKNLIKPNIMARDLENPITCEISITKEVFQEDGYEFIPSEYINKTCAYSTSDPHLIMSNGVRKPEICQHNDNDFGCQTIYEELNVIKRSKRKHDCWEHMVQLVAVGCKCNIHFSYN